MPDIAGDAVQSLVASLRFRTQRQAALAANVANADTPGYRPVDLEFGAALEGAQQRLLRTHSGHLGAGVGPDGDYRVLHGPPGTGPDRNGVDLDRELLQLSRNAGKYNDQANVLSRLFQLTRTAIRGEP